MILEENPANAATAVAYARLLTLLESIGGADPLSAQLQALLGPGTVTTSHPATNITPAWFAAQGGGWSVILIAGCSSLQHGLSTIAGYSGGLLDSVIVPSNSYFTQLRDQILADAGAAGCWSGSIKLCAGHSLGGAVAALIGAAAKQAAPGSQVGVCTFGAPKTADKHVNAWVDMCSPARWMCDDDPVPILIPTAADTLAMLAAFSIRENSRFQNFVHSRGGLSIDAAGNVEPAILPPTASLTTVSSLAAWLASIDQDTHNTHQIEEYVGRLQLRINNSAGSGPPLVHGGQAEEPGTASNSRLNAAQRHAHDALVGAEADNRRVPLTIPAALRFSVSRNGGIWQVSQGETLVSVSSRERTARSLARKLNSAIEGILLQGFTDVDGAKKALERFLDQARTAGSGISPQLEEEFPS